VRKDLEISRTVIDASFLLKLFLPEQKSDEAHQLWNSWIEDSVEIAAPTLLMFEVASVIRNKVHRRIVEERDASEIVERMKRMDMTLVYTDDLLDAAWEIGARLKTTALYDCFYLALSELLVAPLWTADKRLHEAAKGLIPRLNLL
jgi:predicted nucleic acid-binding protein